MIDYGEMRRNLMLLIDCIASGGSSKTYGMTTPYLDSLTELRCMWFDDLYHSPETLTKDGVISSDEAKILNQFSTAFERAYPATPSETNLNRLQGDTVWQSVVSAGRDAQAKLKQLKS